MSLLSYCTSSTADERSFLPTDGPPIQWLSHGGHEGSVQDCRTCGHALAQYLVNDLHIGKGEGDNNVDDDDYITAIPITIIITTTIITITTTTVTATLIAAARKVDFCRVVSG